jgi:gliding motility-associated-like protein
VEFKNLIPGKKYVFHFEGKGITQNTNILFSDKEVSFSECDTRKVEFVALTDHVVGTVHEVIWANKKERNLHGIFYDITNMKKNPAGITVIDGFAPDFLVENVLLGDFCMDVNNVNAPGAAISYGVFFDGELSIIIETGIILSSGSIYNAEGPNNATGTSTNTGGPGDPDLQLVSGTNMNDCAVLEFDFTPDQDSIRFNYVFASEEYCDFVGSPYNDAFGFFLSGPGISGPYTNNAINLARLPDGTPVSINTVNFTTNGMYYVDNTPSNSPISGGCTPEEIANNPKAQLEIEYDGFTVPLVAESPVLPCSTYHIKLAVGDGTDAIFDSAVFIEKNSFISGSTETIVSEVGYTAEDAFEAIEGCEGAYIYFRRIALNTMFDLTFDINVLPSSTAEEGIDFGDIPSTFTIPAGQWGDTLWLDIFPDGIIEGLEVIEMSVIGFCACTDPTFEVYINDPPELFVESSPQEFCEPTNVLLSVAVDGGTPGYLYEWQNGTNTATTVAPFYESGSYFVTVMDDCGQEIVHELYVDIWEHVDTTLNATVCDGEGYVAGGAVQYTAGTYADYFQTVHNCDSIVYTQLNVLPNSDYDTTAYICLGDCALIGGIFICNPGSSNIMLDGQSSNGCDSTIYYEIILNEPIAVVFNPPVLTCYDQEVQLNSAGSTTGDDVTYQWNGPDGYTSNEENPWVDVPGTYTLVIYQDFDGVNCQSNPWPVEVEEDTEPPLADPGGSQTIGCESDSTIVFDASNSDLTNTILEWTGPNGFSSNDPIITVQDSGTYNLNLIDTLNGCVSDTSVQLFINQNSPVVTTQGGYVGCNSNPISIFADSDIAGADFTWEGPNGYTANVSDPLVTDPGIYYVTVSNGGVCFTVDSTEVLFDSTTPDVQAEGDTITCFNPEIQLNSNSNSPNASFEWNGPNGYNSQDQNPLVNEPGTYTVIVTGENGCQDSLEVEVNLNAVYANLASQDDLLNCTVTNVDLDLNSDLADVDYEWEGPNAFNSSDPNPNVNEAGTYYVTVTSNTGCESYDTINITIDTLYPQAVIDYNDLNCFEPISIINLEGLDGSESVQWNGPNGYTSNNSSIDVDVSGDYNVVVTSTNGCTDEATISINENFLLPDVSALGDTITCETGTATLIGSSQTPNTSIEWKNSNGALIGSGDMILVGSPGTYTCIVTNTINGCMDSVFVEALQDSNVPDIQTSGTVIDCNSSNFFIEVSSISGVSFDWEGPNGFISSETNPEIFDAGTYTITVTAANGCIAVENVNVADDSQSPVVALEADTINCIQNNTSITTDATGTGNIYIWSGPNGFNSNLQNPVVSTGGNYIVTVTSANGCTSIMNIDVIEDAAIPTLNVQSSNVITCIDPNTSISANSNNPDVVFNWTGPNGFTSNEQNPVVTQAGTYNIIIEAPNGCTQNSSILVEIDTLSPQLGLQDGYIDCNDPSLLLDLQVNNVSNPTYNWSGPNGFVSDEENPVVNAGGDYFVTVINDNGCLSTGSLIIDENKEVPVSGINLVDFDCDGSDAQISATLSGGQYQFDWTSDNGDQYNGAAISVDQAGMYYLVITDDTNGCSYNDSVFVQALDPVVGFELQTTDPACLNEFGTISFVNVEGGAELMYSIDGGSTFQSSPNFTGLNSGVYDAVVMDGNQCQLFDQTVLAEIVEFEISTESLHIVNYGEDLGIVVETTLDPADIDTIIWSPDTGLSCTNCLDPTLTATINGTYVVTVIDNNGCEDDAIIEIRVIVKDLYVPNIFSPNDDSANDVFTIFGDASQVDKVLSLAVFDRWGNMVFLNEDFGINDPSEGWDGTFNSRTALSGVYVYAAEVLMINGEKRIFGGDITLIR